MAQYKLAKEAFVADNDGTSIWEIQLVSCVGVVSYALYCSMQSLAQITPRVNRLLSSPMFDYVTTFLPLLLGLTIFSDVPVLFNCGILVIVFLVQVEGSLRTNWTRMHANVRSGIAKPSTTTKASQRTKKSHEPPSTSQSSTENAQPPLTEPHQTTITFPHSPFLTIHRAHLSLMTTLCILAIDFPLFPRRFGKTETFGSGLMDVGVGSFVFSAGIAAGGGWLKMEAGRVIADAEGRIGGGIGAMGQMRKAFRRAIPLIALGMIRVIMVKGVEYPEHITEYGVHWNFFFTLAAMPFVLPVFSAVRSRIRGARFWMLAFALGIVNEIILQHYFQGWILSPTRTGLLGKNKEGLVSLAGYVAIYLFGIDLGCMIVPSDPALLGRLEKIERESRLGNGKNGRHAKAALLRMSTARKPEETGTRLAWYACASWGLLGLMRACEQPISRRMANLPYVLWTVAFNSTFLLGYLAVELWFFPPEIGSRVDRLRNSEAVPPLLAAINKNGLVLFLLANLLTGLVNLTFETMYASTFSAMMTLVGYTLVFSAVAWTLRTVRIAM